MTTVPNMPPMGEWEDTGDTIRVEYQGKQPGMNTPDDRGTPNDSQSVEIQPPQAIPPEPTTPWERDLTPWAMTGNYDAWIGTVLATHFADTGGDKQHKMPTTVEVRRIMPRIFADAVTDRLDKNIIPAVGSQPQEDYVKAMPFPRLDVQNYTVKVGEPVIVLTGRDGRHYYMPDDQPFIGKVIDWPKRYAEQYASTDEDFAGGAGTTTIAVQRYKLGIDPDGTTFTAPSLTALAPEATPGGGGVALVYNRVYVVKPAYAHHGYRPLDMVMVFRKGNYYFALPAMETFHAHIIAVGPQSEVDFTDENYWVQQISENIAYDDDLVADHFNHCIYVGTHTHLGRILQAKNLAEEIADSHLLPTDGTRKVVVHMYCDSADNDPYYVFEAWAPALFSFAVCQQAAYDPLGGPSPKTKLAPVGTNATGNPATAGTVWATGWMYKDANNNWNPWICLTAFPNSWYTDTFCSDPAGKTPLAGASQTAANNITDLTDGASASKYYAAGWMYQDAYGKWNPWIRFLMSGDNKWIEVVLKDGAATTNHIGPVAGNQPGPGVGDPTKAPTTITLAKDGDDWFLYVNAEKVGYGGIQWDTRGHLLKWHRASDATWYVLPQNAVP